MKKTKKLLLFLIMSIFLISCAKDADEAADSDDVSENTINGKWKHSNGDVLSISIATGNGAYLAGPAPSGAVGGNALTGVTYVRGLYWEAKSHTYYSSGWSSTYNAIGIAMADDKKTFKIGTQVYTRQ